MSIRSSIESLTAAKSTAATITKQIKEKKKSHTY
jgi:hypothetical protein